MKFSIVWLFWLIFSIKADAQDSITDNTPLLSYELRARNHLMATRNTKQLADYWSNATAAYGSIQTKTIGGFYLHTTATIIANTGDTSFNRKDPIANKPSNWERELMNLDHVNRRISYRFDEMYLGFQNPNWDVKVGRHIWNQEPFFNKRDSRMVPFAQQGIFLKYSTRSLRVDAAYVNSISPRSYSSWFKLSEAYGLNNTGANPDGSPSGYGFKTNSRFLLAMASQITQNNWTHKGWILNLDRLNTTFWHESTWNKDAWTIGGQLITQKPSNHQKNIAYEIRYQQPTEQPIIISQRVKHLGKRWSHQWSSSIIFGKGRFLFPRELGRESIYTSVPRSFADGLGKSIITSYEVGYHGVKRLSVQLSTIYVRPDQAGSINNKYGIPQYIQWNTSVKWSHPKWQNYRLNFLYVYRKSLGKNELPLAKQFYRANFHNFSLIQEIAF